MPPKRRKQSQQQRRTAAVLSQVLGDGDLLVLILTKLDSVAQLSQADAVCQQWHEAGRSNPVWKHFLAAAFPSSEALTGVTSYRALYARMKGIDPTQKPRACPITDYQFYINFRQQVEGGWKPLASLCISDPAQLDTEDTVLYYGDDVEGEGEEDDGGEEGDFDDEPAGEEDDEVEEDDGEDGEEGEGEGEGEDEGEGEGEGDDSDEDASDADSDGDSGDSDEEQEAAEALADTVRDAPPFHVRAWLDIPSLEWLWEPLAEMIGADAAEAMQLRMSGDGEADARVLQQAVTTLTECVCEHDAGFLSMLDVSAFRVRDQRVAKLVAVGPLDDLVGLNEMSFEGIEPAVSGRHRRTADEHDSQDLDQISFHATLRPSYDPKAKRLRWIFGLRLVCCMHAIGNVDMTLPEGEFLHALERVPWV